MEVRIDPITDQASLQATARSQRPHFGKSRPVHPPLDQHRSSAEFINANPFLPGNEHITGPESWADSDIPNRKANHPNWKVRVIPNKYPITDYHEVVILSPDPKRDFAQISLKQAQRVINAFVSRSQFMDQHGQSFLYCNHGLAAGASISHPHAQIVAFPTVPPAVRQEIDSLKQAYDKTGNCLQCQLVDHEEKLKTRVVWQNNHFLILCPEAAGWPYAISIIPKIHQSHLGSLKVEYHADFARALQLAIKLYRVVLHNPSYNFWVHSAKGHFYHWHLDLIPRTKTLAGVELGAGIMVNDRISPEDAAKQFRLALKSMK
jgi:UDPglucose--hexose-1-phosphate uridylyltransferase